MHKTSGEKNFQTICSQLSYFLCVDCICILQGTLPKWSISILMPIWISRKKIFLNKHLIKEETKLWYILLRGYETQNEHLHIIIWRRNVVFSVRVGITCHVLTFNFCKKCLGEMFGLEFTVETAELMHDAKNDGQLDVIKCTSCHPKLISCIYDNSMSFETITIIDFV